MNNKILKEFFELGEAYAFSKMSFDHLRYQATQQGGEMERSSLQIKDDFVKLKTIFEVPERIDTVALTKEIVKLDLDLHKLQSQLVSALLFGGRADTYDTVG